MRIWCKNNTYLSTVSIKHKDLYKVKDKLIYCEIIITNKKKQYYIYIYGSYFWNAIIKDKYGSTFTFKQNPFSYYNNSTVHGFLFTVEVYLGSVQKTLITSSTIEY